MCVCVPYFLSLFRKFPSERHCVGRRVIDVEQLVGEGKEGNVGEVKLLLGQGSQLRRRGDVAFSAHVHAHHTHHTHAYTTHLITEVHLSLCGHI